MFITLTNTNPDIRGQKISINANSIVTIREGVAQRPDQSNEYVTYIYCPPHGTWEVEESHTDIIKMIESNKVIDLN